MTDDRNFNSDSLNFAGSTISSRSCIRNNINKQSLIYINRLSDFLFVVSRTTNDNGKADILWVPGENQ